MPNKNENGSGLKYVYSKYKRLKEEYTLSPSNTGLFLGGLFAIVTYNHFFKKDTEFPPSKYSEFLKQAKYLAEEYSKTILTKENVNTLIKKDSNQAVYKFFLNQLEQVPIKDMFRVREMYKMIMNPTPMPYP